MYPAMALFSHDRFFRPIGASFPEMRKQKSAVFLKKDHKYCVGILKYFLIVADRTRRGKLGKKFSGRKQVKQGGLGHDSGISPNR
jgi:hypothetical protein